MSHLPSRGLPAVVYLAVLTRSGSGDGLGDLGAVGGHTVGPRGLPGGADDRAQQPHGGVHWTSAFAILLPEPCLSLTTGEPRPEAARSGTGEHRVGETKW